MNTLKEIYENPGKFDLSFEAIKRLRQIHIAFETNPFFPVPRYEYARAHLKQMFFSGLIDAQLMQTILNEF